jgi:methyltransferase family protein
MNKRLKKFLTGTAAGSRLLAPYRFNLALRCYMPRLKKALSWSLSAREFTNFTYEITEENIEYLAHTVSAVTGATFSSVREYIQELDSDDALKQHVVRLSSSGGAQYYSDSRCCFARRLGWYAFARILKPGVVVETGVDKGLGSVVLCAALLRNQEDGRAGQYFGTDINPEAGFLLTEPYSRVGKILFGDSIESLRSISSIDLFINDSDHSADYERREYEAVRDKLTPQAVILGDNADCTNELAKFSEKHGRNFIFFKEQPKDHWYPGAGIGISFIRKW